MPPKPASTLTVTSRRPPLTRLLALTAIVLLGLYVLIPHSTLSEPDTTALISDELKQTPADAYTSFTADYAQLEQNALTAVQEIKSELAEAKQRAADAKVEAEKARGRSRDVKQSRFNALREKEKEKRRKDGKGDKQEDLSLTLVLGRLKEEEAATNWTKALYGVNRLAEYIVDDPTAPLSLKENKGREAMVYMQYIINHWDNLTDVTVFTHSGNLAWHNNVLLSADLVPTINRLRRAHVVEKGYFNTRCELWPGCPRWIKFDADRKTQQEFVDRALDTYTAQMWEQLFPGEPVPNFLSEPCCSQFAVSRAAIRVNKKITYERIRDYLSSQDLEQFSGRQMEYIWQYLFTGEEELCPSMKQCYCDGYGICMDDDTELIAYNLARKQDDEGWRNFNDGGAQMKDKAQRVQGKLSRLLPERLGWKSPFAKTEWAGDSAEWFGFDLKQGGWDVDEESTTTLSSTSSASTSSSSSSTAEGPMPPEAALTSALTEVSSATTTATATEESSSSATATDSSASSTADQTSTDEKATNAPDPTKAEEALDAKPTQTDAAAALLQGAETHSEPGAAAAADTNIDKKTDTPPNTRDAAPEANEKEDKSKAGDAALAPVLVPLPQKDMQVQQKVESEKPARHDPGWNQASVNYFGNQQLGQDPNSPQADLRLGASYT